MVCVFARQTSEPLASLVKQIDRKIAENKQLKSFVVTVLGGLGNPMGTILAACALTGAYVAWANRKYDPMVEDLRKRRGI